MGIANEVYIGVPESVPRSSIACLDGMAGLEALWPCAYPDGFMKNLLTQPNSYTGRAFRNPAMSLTPGVMDYDRREVQAVEMPASGGVGTARAIATMYRAVERVINSGLDDDGSDGKTTDNNPLGLSRKFLVDILSSPAKPGRSNGWIDEVFGVELCMGAGMLLPSPPDLQDDTTDDGGGRFFCAPGRFSFGTSGAGGGFGYCDVDAEIAYSYVMNRCGQLIVDDPREFALRDKVYEAVQRIQRREEGGPRDDEVPDYPKRSPPHYLSNRYMKAHPELYPLA